MIERCSDDKRAQIRRVLEAANPTNAFDILHAARKRIRAAGYELPGITGGGAAAAAATEERSASYKAALQHYTQELGQGEQAADAARESFYYAREVVAGAGAALRGMPCAGGLRTLASARGRQMLATLLPFLTLLLHAAAGTDTTSLAQKMADIQWLQRASELSSWPVISQLLPQHVLEQGQQAQQGQHARQEQQQGQQGQQQGRQQGQQQGQRTPWLTLKLLRMLVQNAAEANRRDKRKEPEGGGGSGGSSKVPRT